MQANSMCIPVKQLQYDTSSELLRHILPALSCTLEKAIACTRLPVAEHWTQPYLDTPSVQGRLVVYCTIVIVEKH